MPSSLSPQFSVIKNMAARGYDVNKGTHGTKFIPGMTSVQPSSKANAGSVHPGISDPTRAYYTANKPVQEAGDSPERSGWTWANIASNNNMDQAATSPTGTDYYAGRRPGRPVVHQVEPVGRIDEDRLLNPKGKVSSELTADSLKITDTEWIQPPSYKSEGTQGTLPQENWNRFGQADYEDRNNISVEQQRVNKQKTQKSASQPSTNQQQFKTWKARKNLPGQLEMLDRPPTWHAPARKADL